MSRASDGYAPHPYTGGRAAVLRALTAWRMEWPGTPNVLVLTGRPGSGRSRLITGFLMLCDPEYRKRLPLDDLDPTTVPPELPAPAVPTVAGLTAAQALWLLADHYGLDAGSAEEVYAQLAALDEPVTVVVPDTDRAGPVRGAGAPARLVRDVLVPLAATGNVRLLAEADRAEAAELAASLPPGTVRIIDLDEPEWADPDGLVLHAQAALNPDTGAPELPFTTDASVRLALGAAVAGRAGGSPLVVELAVNCLLLASEGFDPGTDAWLPSSVGEALDLHARRLDADPGTLRSILAPLALAGGDGLPVRLWPRLVSAVAEQDMSRAVADGMRLAGPFLRPLDEGPGDDGGRTLLRLLHPAVGAEIRAGLPDVRAAQTRIALALLEAVPDQDWSKADRYVRDHLAGHTLEAGLLPQLLTDPGLFVHADPVSLRAAVEAVPAESLGAPARTYLRTAPLLTRTEAPAPLRAALLETAFVEDGLPEYAEAVHRLGLDLPWRTLWSRPVPGASAVTVGSLPGAEDGPAVPVAVVVVPAGTPGAYPVDGSGALVWGLVLPDDLGGAGAEYELGLVRRPSEQERAKAPLGLSRGADYLRVWDRASGEVVAALISDTPFTAADLSPDGVLLVATERGVKALRVLGNRPALASGP
ncbi:ATP-binding protein [Streptomyces sp. NPDC023723]|uniref:ATP-binding protein n=1 Tax=Streptomyces sp. NPDC023723 TaxID=3154323 RepID=UPI0034065172